MLKQVVLVSLLLAVSSAQEPVPKMDNFWESVRKPRMGLQLPNMPFANKASELIDKKIQGMRDALKNQPDACNPLFLLKAKECANVPVVFSPKQFGQCFQDLAEASKTAQGNNGGSSRKKRQSADEGAGEAANAPDSGMGQTAKNKNVPMAALMRAGVCGDPQCAAECVMKKTNYIDADGNLNQVALSQSYVDNATDSWKTIAANAVQECFNNATNTAARYRTNAVPNSKCSDKPIRFMACVQRYLILNAPANDEVKSPTPKETCQARINQLQRCDPNYIIQIGKGGCPQLQSFAARARVAFRRATDRAKKLINNIF